MWSVLAPRDCQRPLDHAARELGGFRQLLGAPARANSQRVQHYPRDERPHPKLAMIWILALHLAKKSADPEVRARGENPNYMFSE